MSEFDAPLEDVQPEETDGGLFDDLGLSDINIDLPDVDFDGLMDDAEGLLDDAEGLVDDVEEWAGEVADSAGDLVDDLEVPDFVQELFDSAGSLDLIGADPDEDGFWQDLMINESDDVNPYVAN